MLNSTRLQIDRIKVTEDLNRIEVRADDPDREARAAERRTLEAKLSEINEKLVSALEEEDRDAQLAMARNVDDSGWTPELRELRQVAQRTTIADYVAATIEGRNVGGAALEYNQHVFGTWNPGDYPLEMLLDRDEIIDFGAEQVGHLQPDNEARTVITGVGGTHGNPTFVDRILAGSEGTYLRASYPVVGPGRHSYPIVTGNTVAATIARDTAEDPSGGLTITNADPDRVQHSYEYAAADELQIPGIANGLASDLRMSLMAGLDNKVVFAVESGATDVDVTAGTTLTAAGLIAAVHGVVDGRGARYFREVRLLAGNTAATSQTTAFSRIGALLAATTIDAVFNWFADIRASGHMSPAAAGEDDILAVKTGPAAPRLIVPVWRRGSLLRDSGRLQLRGQITLTGVMYADAIMVNSDLHTNLSVETQ